jgi:hypothetical protein
MITYYVTIGGTRFKFRDSFKLTGELALRYHSFVAVCDCGKRYFISSNVPPRIREMALLQLKYEL